MVRRPEKQIVTYIHWILHKQEQWQFQLVPWIRHIECGSGANGDVRDLHIHQRKAVKIREMSLGIFINFSKLVHRWFMLDSRTLLIFQQNQFRSHDQPPIHWYVTLPGQYWLCKTQALLMFKTQPGLIRRCPFYKCKHTSACRSRDCPRLVPDTNSILEPHGQHSGLDLKWGKSSKTWVQFS